MSHVRCRILIGEGKYGRRPTEASVGNVLEWVFSDSLYELDFMAPEKDLVVDAEATVLLKSRYRHWGHDEAARDRIVTALVNRLRPEYESQVEVEIIEEPEDSFDDSPDEDFDDSDFGIDRIQRVWQ